MKKRLIALLTAVLLLVSILPLFVSAAVIVSDHVGKIEITIDDPVEEEPFVSFLYSMSVNTYDDQGNVIDGIHVVGIYYFGYEEFDYNKGKSITNASTVMTDKYYGLDINIAPVEGYYIDSNTKYTVNGSTASIFTGNSGYDIDRKELFISFALETKGSTSPSTEPSTEPSDAPSADPVKITKIEITADNPVVGKTVGSYMDSVSFKAYDEQGNLVTDNGLDGFTLTAYTYTSFRYNTAVRAGSTQIISADNFYGFDFETSAKSGYTIPGTAVITVNGSDASIFTDHVYNDRTNIIVPFALAAVPATDPSTDPSEAPSIDPSEEPTTDPSESPSEAPSENPSTDPSENPTDDPIDPPSTGEGFTLTAWIMIAALAFAMFTVIKRRA